MDGFYHDNGILVSSYKKGLKEAALRLYGLLLETIDNGRYDGDAPDDCVALRWH